MTKEKKNTYDEMLERINQQFTSGLEENGLMWFKDWNIQPNSRNGKTNTNYHGANHLNLAMNGFIDSRYYTFKQANELGYKVRKGSKAQEIVKFAYWDKKEKKYLSYSEYSLKKLLPETSDDVCMFLKTYYLFNAEQLDGIELEKHVEKHFNIDLITAIAKAMGVSVNVGSHYKAPCYVPSEHAIYLPSLDMFKTQSGLLATALHELSHATGKALEREMKGDKKSKSYAYEELIAETSATILCNYFEIENGVNNNHKAYINSWLTSLKGDKKYFVNAFKEAEKASAYIIDLYEKEANKQVEKIDNSEKAIPETITSVTVDDKNGQTSFKLNNRSTSSQLKLNNEWMKKAPKTTIKQICRKWKGATTEDGLDILDFMQVFRPDCF